MAGGLSEEFEDAESSQNPYAHVAKNGASESILEISKEIEQLESIPFNLD